MNRILLTIIAILAIHFAIIAQNGTQPDSNRVIVGSQVVRTIDVLANDTLNPNKSYILHSVYTSTTSPTVQLTIANGKVTYREMQTNASQDTFYYVVQNTLDNTLDTSYVVIYKSDLIPDVLPGDANLDHIVNHLDYLYIASAIGQSGIEREGIYRTEQWSQQRAYDWTQSNLGGNFKHFDANGSGYIDTTGDFRTIASNYGRTFNIPKPSKYSPTGGPTFDIQIVDTLIVSNSAVPLTFSISLGTPAAPIDSCLGIAFTLHYDSTVLSPTHIQVLPQQWFATTGRYAATFNSTHSGQIDVLLTRLGSGSQASGELTKVNIVIEDILDGIIDSRDLSFWISKALLVQPNLKPIPVTLPTSPKKVTLKKSTNALKSNHLNDIKISQQSGMLTISSQHILSDITVTDLRGVTIHTYQSVTPLRTHTISTHNWAKGIYFVTTSGQSFKIKID